MITQIEQQALDAIIKLSREYRKQNRMVKIECTVGDKVAVEYVRIGAIKALTKSPKLMKSKKGEQEWSFNISFVGDEETSYDITEENYNKLLEELI